jgi:purine-binding chemotaxis protein CheW
MEGCAVCERAVVGTGRGTGRRTVTATASEHDAMAGAAASTAPAAGAPEPSLAADAAAVLQARARRLAERLAADPHDAADDAVEVLEFSVDGAPYVVATAHVGGVHPLRQLTPLPCVPARVLGLVNVRGRIVPVMSLSALVGGSAQPAPLPSAASGDAGNGCCLILLQSADVELAVMADGPGRVTRVRTGLLQAVPRLQAPAGSETDAATAARPNAAHQRDGSFIRGVTADGRAWLDAQRLLADPRLRVDDTTETGTDTGTTEETP